MISWRVVNHPSGRSNLPYENRSKPIAGCTPPGAATAAFCQGFTGLQRHLDEFLCAAAISHILLRSETDSDRGSLRKEPRRRVQAKPSSLSRRDQGFESAFLQRRVGCELETPRWPCLPNIPRCAPGLDRK